MRFDIPWIFLIPYLFVLGATIGSFLNVCVYRLPKHERLLDQIRGLWSPPSHCPRCKRRILLRDNLPVVGWLRLAGRCRFCRTRISPRYPLIEAANGLLFVGLFLCEVPTGSFARVEDSCLFSPLGPHAEPHSSLLSPAMVCFWRWLYHLVLVESLVVASLIDFDQRIIPDGATLPAMAVGVLGSLAGCLYIVPVWFQDASLLHSLMDVTGSRFGSWMQGPPVPLWIADHPHWHGLAVSLAGLVVGGGSVWVVRILGQWVLKREAMGFGDVILMATIGSFLGWQPTLIVFFLAPLCALVVVAACLVFRRDREIPYGPYLSLATLVVIVGLEADLAGDRAILFARAVCASRRDPDVRPPVFRFAHDPRDQAPAGNPRLPPRGRVRHLGTGRSALPFRQRSRPVRRLETHAMAGRRRRTGLAVRAALEERQFLEVSVLLDWRASSREPLARRTCQYVLACRGNRLGKSRWP